MNRLMFAVMALVLLGAGVFAENVTSIAQTEQPYFQGLGFALRSDESNVVECKIVQVKQTDLKTGQSSDCGVFKGMIDFANDSYVLKLINPSLKAFEADIIQENGAKLNVPVGHISFKVGMSDPKHTTAIGKILIKSATEGASGEFNLYLNVPNASGTASPKP
ncbi:MAG: hypothetical protein HQM09_04970 [Candidatus Riflebacteria bacterium]|nr:hypothetical protein [Candidatus Riflebacteria bacterium]